MKSRNRYLLKNTAIFTIGNLATKLITFFLIPIYTNVLSTSEYGVIDIIITVSTVAVPILTLNIMESVMRFNLDPDANHDLISKIGITILLISIIVALPIILICNNISILSNYGYYVYLYCVSSAICQVLLSDLRGKELLVQYSVGNVINTFFIAIFNIIFLVVLKRGVEGYLLAYIISNLLVSLYALIVGKSYKSWHVKINKKVMLSMLKYSIILIPNSFMWWIMNSSDHLMVTSMVSVAANGVYAISYKLPTLISTFVGIFNQAWGYSAIKEEKAKDVNEYTNKVFRTLVVITNFVALSMMTIIKPFLKVYVSNEYYSAWKYTPFLIMGFVFMTFGTFVGTSYTVRKDSKGMLLTGISGAFLNIFLNYLMIPIIGVYGAALSTCVSYICVFFVRVFNTRKYLKYKLLTKEFMIGILFLVLSAILIIGQSIIFQLFQIILIILFLIIFKRYWVIQVKNLFNKLKGIYQ